MLSWFVLLLYGLGVCVVGVELSFWVLLAVFDVFWVCAVDVLCVFWWYVIIFVCVIVCLLCVV